jgi:hypothetical protein
MDGSLKKGGRASGPVESTLETIASVGSAGDRSDRGPDDRPTGLSFSSEGGIE